jgi:hypothetical protein
MAISLSLERAHKAEHGDLRISSQCNGEKGCRQLISGALHVILQCSGEFLQCGEARGRRQIIT